MKKLTLEQKLFLNGFRPDEESHIRIKDPEKCRKCTNRKCTTVCPVNAYRWENDQLTDLLRRLPGVRHLPHRLSGLRQHRVGLPAGRVRGELPHGVAACGGMGVESRVALAGFASDASGEYGLGRLYSLLAATGTATPSRSVSQLSTLTLSQNARRRRPSSPPPPQRGLCERTSLLVKPRSGQAVP